MVVKLRVQIKLRQALRLFVSARKRGVWFDRDALEFVFQPWWLWDVSSTRQSSTFSWIWRLTEPKSMRTWRVAGSIPGRCVPRPNGENRPERFRLCMTSPLWDVKPQTQTHILPQYAFFRLNSAPLHFNLTACHWFRQFAFVSNMGIRFRQAGMLT